MFLSTSQTESVKMAALTKHTWSERGVVEHNVANTESGNPINRQFQYSVSTGIPVC